MDPLKDTINDTEGAGEKFADHVGERIAQQIAGVLPTLEGYELCIRISLEKKA